MLAEDGTLFVHLDDNELGYAIAVIDEAFGRQNRAAVVTFKQGSATGHKAINRGLVSTSNFILVYARNKQHWNPARVFTARERDTRYSQFIVNRRADHEQWRLIPLLDAFASEKGVSPKMARTQAKKDPAALDEFVLSNAHSVVQLARPNYEGVSAAARALIDTSLDHPEIVFRLQRDEHSDMCFLGGQRILFYADKIKHIDGQAVSGEPLTTIWDDILSNNLHKEGDVDFPKGKKPEGLIKRCLDLSTSRGDLVLDSFAGSGTTGAVAHKMGRRWIMVELGEHCHTHIIPRMRKVIDGQDRGGVTEATGWKGGGGFRYYRLAPSLLEQDKWGHWIISKEFNPTLLAEALCKLEGFQYAPSETVWWQHGHSTERDFLYVTTQNLSAGQLQQLSDEVGPDRSLLVLCPAFRGRAEQWSNLTVRKIPKHVLTRCEWGHDDYSLAVENLPQAPPEPGQQSLFEAREEATK